MPESGTSGSVGAAGEQLPAATRPSLSARPTRPGRTVSGVMAVHRLGWIFVDGWAYLLPQWPS